MGASASTSTSGSDFQPNSEEISKAVVLSSLAYLDKEKRKATIANRYSRIGLQNIVMADDFILGKCKQNNAITLFVAFRWPFCIQDMFTLKVAGKNEFSESYKETAKDVRGLFHFELFERITRNLPSMFYFQKYKADKIIFSGHSLAGALAHLFLITYMLHTREEAKRHISIGFGSPYFCDSDAKQFCEKFMEMDRRMFTLVHGADPVPWLLMGIRMTVACNAESIGRIEAEKLSSCLNKLNSWLDPANSEEMIEIKAKSLWALKIILKEMQSTDRSESPPYVNVGAYYEGKELKSVNPVTDVKLTDINAWSCHRVEYYVEEFIVCMNGQGCLIRRVTEESSPCIHACNLNIYQGPKCHGVIAIRGVALSELKEFGVIAHRGVALAELTEFRVAPKVGCQWMVESSNDSNILLSGVLSKTEVVTINIWENEKNTEQIHLFVYIRTCFGFTAAKVSVENPWRDSYVAHALNRSLGRLLLMQQTNFPKSRKYSEAYGALRCVFSQPFDLSEQTKKKHCESVGLFLTKPMEMPIPNNMLQKFKDALALTDSAPGWQRKLNVIFSTVFLCRPENLLSVISGDSCISRFPNENRSSYEYCLCDNKLRKLNYFDILRTIYCLLTGTESELEESTEASHYEEEIYRHVHSKGPGVKRRQGLPEGIVKDIEGRAWKIYKIIWACNLLEDFRMAAFIGPENAGKTTLINSLLGENVGDVGFTTHTSAAIPYRFTSDIFLIDFPGTDAGGERADLSNVWECYDKVADLCIVVLNFGGDTSGAAEEFVWTARSRMCENVVLVINRVDSVLNGSRSSPVWFEYSPSKLMQLRMSFAESCGLSRERVFLSVSKPDEELEETTRQLLEERPSIMMKEEITRKLRWMICETRARMF